MSAGGATGARWLLAGVLGVVLGWVAGSVLRIRRREVEARLRAAGVERPRQVARAMYASLGTGVGELVLSAVSERLPVRLSARAEQALASVPGAVVATAHTGNWDLGACAVAGRAPLWVVSKRLRVGWLDRVWQRLRRGRGVRVVDARGAWGEARRALGEGGLVAMIIDQAPERASGVIALDFLGQRAWYDLAPALLAARTGKPLALALSRRCEQGGHEIDVPVVLWPPEGAGRAWAVEATGALNAELERFVRAWPAQWLWLHRRWKPLPTRGAAC